MKRHFFKKGGLAAILLAAAMLAASCSTGTAPSSSVPASEPDSSAPVSSQEEIKTHKLRLLGVNRDKEFVNWDDLDEFPGWQKFQEELKARGIELTFERVLADQYKIMLQTKFAAGNDLPDIVNLSEYDDASAIALGESGMILEVNSLIDQYSDGTIRKVAAERAPFDGKAATAPDGKRYWFTNVQNLFYPKKDGSIIPCPMVIGNSIRQDWLDKYSLDMPATWDEYLNALRTFQEQDANGNGKKDEVLMYDPYSYNFFNGIAQWFGLVPSMPNEVPIGVDVANEELVCAWYQPGAKAYFEAMKQLVDEGLIDKDLVQITDEQFSQAIAEDRVSAHRNYSQGLYWEQLINEDPNAKELYMLVPPVQCVDGIEPYILKEASEFTNGKYVITKACEDPEGAIKLMDYLYSDEGRKTMGGGVEGVDSKKAGNIFDIGTYWFMDKEGNWRSNAERLDENQNIKNNEDGTPFIPEMTKDEMYQNRVGWVANDFIGGTVLPKIAFANQPFLSRDPRNSRKMALQIELMTYENYYFTNNNTVLAIATPEEADIVNKYLGDLSAASNELSIKLILGQKSLNDWDQHIEELRKFGLDEVLKVYQARYDRFKDGQ